MRPDEAERIVLALTRRQHGVVSWEQVGRAALSAGWVRHRIARGWLRRVHRGVYLVGPLETPHSQAMAATLAGGDGALLSHYPAAVLWGLRPPAEGPIDVTVPGRKVRRRPGIRVHRGDVNPADATRRHNIPVTSAARTLLDLATVTSQKELNRAVDEARVHHLASDPSLNEQFRRYPTHRGTAAIEGSDPDRAGAHPVRSGAAAR